MSEGGATGQCKIRDINGISEGFLFSEITSMLLGFFFFSLSLT